MANPSQCEILLAAMRRGEKLTVATALEKYGVYALSQRMGELRRKHGIDVKSEIIEVGEGKRVAQYWIEPGPFQQAMF